MTNREFFEEVVKAEINEEMTEFATEAIAKLDKTNAARKEKTNAKTEEFNAFAKEIADGVESGAVITATEAGEKFSVSTQKASSALRRAEELGYFTSDIVKSGKSKVKGYTKV